jgi:hypothetical protein
MSDEQEYTAPAEADAALSALADELDSEAGDSPYRDDDPPAPPAGDEVPARTKRLEADEEPPADGELPPDGDGTPKEDDPPPDPTADVVDWSFRAYGQELTIPGAKYKPDHGAFIPEESLGQVRQLIARGVKYERLQQERDQLRGAISTRELEAQAVLDVIAPILTPERLTQAALNPDLTLKELTLALKERKLNLEQQYGQQVYRGQPQQDDGELVEQVQEQIDTTLAEIVSTVPDIRQVLQARRDVAPQILNAARRAAQAFYVPAPFDHPRGAFKRGELVLDTHEFAAHVRTLVAPYAAAAPAPKAVPAAAPKKPVQAVTAPPAPGRPTRSAATTTTPQARKPKEPPTKQQIRDELDAALRELAQ